MFINGVRGTDKLFPIEALKQFMDGTSDDLTCAVAAPTGLAAFNICGDNTSIAYRTCTLQECVLYLNSFVIIRTQTCILSVFSPLQD